ncbi:Cdc73 protein [Martiniozyma asiatica (nom. inval.)]|nr:Cdc73 protein [Martiniozyma asiatica]
MVVDKLRLALTGGANVKIENDHLILENESFLLNEKSGFEEFDLGTVWFAWENKDLSTAEYLSKSKDANQRPIGFIDRNRLILYLSGESESLETTEIEQIKRPIESTTIEIDKQNKKQKIESDPLLKQVLTNEIEFIDHNKALRGSKLVNFSQVKRECELKIIRPSLKQAKEKSSSSSSNNNNNSNSNSNKSKSKSSSSSSSSNKPDHGNNSNNNLGTSLAVSLKKKDPIIIISPSATAMINMSNIESFLKDGVFKSSDNLVGSKQMLHISRQSSKFGGKKIRFLFLSHPEKHLLSPASWDRVVAVFTTGQEWQFKNYKYSQPNELFQKVKGFWVGWEGEIPENVRGWNVESVGLKRGERFTDKMKAEGLWESLEKWMAARGYK